MKSKNFEDMMMRLDEITEILSDNNRPLQELLDLFKEATSIVSDCNQTIEEAKLTVDEYKKLVRVSFNEDTEK